MAPGPKQRSSSSGAGKFPHLFCPNSLFGSSFQLLSPLPSLSPCSPVHAFLSAGFTSLPLSGIPCRPFEEGPLGWGEAPQQLLRNSDSDAISGPRWLPCKAAVTQGASSIIQVRLSLEGRGRGRWGALGFSAPRRVWSGYSRQRQDRGLGEHLVLPRLSSPLP